MSQRLSDSTTKPNSSNSGPYHPSWSLGACSRSRLSLRDPDSYTARPISSGSSSLTKHYTYSLSGSVGLRGRSSSTNASNSDGPRVCDESSTAASGVVVAENVSITHVSSSSTIGEPRWRLGGNAACGGDRTWHFGWANSRAETLGKGRAAKRLCTTWDWMSSER